MTFTAQQIRLPEDGKHTPGPWSANLAYRSDDALIVAHAVGADGRSVAQLMFHGEDETEANARLIAAAPELLAALVELHRECIAAAERAGTTWPLSGPAAALDEKVRAAIAKATSHD